MTSPAICRGQAMAEQMLLCVALVLALCVPRFEGVPVGAWLLRSLLEYFRGQSFLLSIL